VDRVLVNVVRSFGASQGLGYLIAWAASSYRVDVMFASVLVFMGLSLLLILSVKLLEARLARWRPEAAKTF
jgi:ABC-type nitrate/sulfonate/bicarbonate transport system permease component